MPGTHSRQFFASYSAIHRVLDRIPQVLYLAHQPDALCQIRPSYAGMLHVYQRALSQRNALLKDIGRFPELRDTLEVWDARLIQLGAAVMEERRRYVEKIQVYRRLERRSP